VANSLATLVFEASPGVIPASTLGAILLGVPFPSQNLKAIGAQLVSDATVPGPPATRTVQMRFAPTVDATATSTLVPGDGQGAPVQTLTLVGGGQNYPGRPIVRFVGGGKPERSALATATLNVLAGLLVASGSGYTAPVVTFVGGLPNDGTGRTATAHATVALGSIVAIVIDDHGAGYVGVPDIVITDPNPAATGGQARANMQVDALKLIDGGLGYSSPPTPLLIPGFKATWPDTSDQRQAFFNAMTGAIASASAGPVVALAPVIS
jgi:hypothetical protein